MTDLNRVFLAGNLTRDPEIRYIPSGKAVGELRLAVNRTYKTATGESRDETCFVGVVVWGRQAETCGEYLSKGSPALVEGRLQYDEWEKDGQKHNRLRVVADRVQFLGRKKTDGGDEQRERNKAEREDAADMTREENASPPADTKAPTPGDAVVNDEDNLPF